MARARLGYMRSCAYIDLWTYAHTKVCTYARPDVCMCVCAYAGILEYRHPVENSRKVLQIALGGISMMPNIHGR